MKKLKKGRKFSRKRDQRKALYKSLCRNLILNGKIKTTLARAKEIKRIIEKMVTKAKKGGLINQRYLLRYFDKKTVKKLMQEIAPLYKNRNGGYVRIYKLVPRISDSAKMAIIEFVK